MDRNPSEPRALWLILALTCVIGAGGIGFAAGYSGGADVSKARAAGARAGRARGTADGMKQGDRAGYAAGHKAGYDKAFKAASAKTSTGGGP